MRNILFLDIDGVLNTYTQNYYRHENPLPLEDRMCPELLANLKLVCDIVPDLEIVLSSAWRYWYYKEVQDILWKHLGSNRLIGFTPMFNDEADRIYEIAHYMTLNNLWEESIVVVDDNFIYEGWPSKTHAQYATTDQLEKIQGRFVRTRSTDGLDERRYLKVAAKFQGDC